MREPEIVHHLIVPPEEAEKLVAQAGKVYLRDCLCRQEMQVCPREKWKVCLLFEHASEEERQQAREITLDEALRIVRITTERGDIHQIGYFQHGARPFEICNCCTCCCFVLREAKEKNNYAEQLRCGYVAITNAALCTGCGLCEEACPEVFELQEDVAKVIVGEVPPEAADAARDAADECPVEAITIEE